MAMRGQWAFQTAVSPLYRLHDDVIQPTPEFGKCCGGLDAITYSDTIAQCHASTSGTSRLVSHSATPPQDNPPCWNGPELLPGF